MVDSTAPAGTFQRRSDAMHELQQFVIGFCRLTPLRIPGIEVSKLDLQDCGLHCVKPAVIPFNEMVVFLVLSVISKHPNSLGYCWIIRRDSSSLSTCAEIFTRVKAERGSFAHGAGLLPAAANS